MTQKTIAPYATIDLTVSFNEKIAISTNGGKIVTIYYQTGPGISPARFYVHDRIVNEEVVLGTFTSDQVVRIVTTGSSALYDIGTDPSVGSGDADTLKGLAPTQFLRSDIADESEAKITFSAGPTINNNTALNMKESGGTERVVLIVDGSNIFNAGNSNLETSIKSNGTTNIVSSHAILSYGFGVYIKDSGGTNRRVALLNAPGTEMKMGDTNLSTGIYSNGTLSYNGTTLASGSIDTTATQTITVVDGLITNIA